MTLQSLKNGIAAAAIGVSTLGAVVPKKAPAIEKAAVQTSQTAKVIANNLTKDTVTFAKAKAYTDSLKHVNQDLKYTKGLVETMINISDDLKVDYLKYLKMKNGWLLSKTQIEKDMCSSLNGVAWKNEIADYSRTMEYLRNFFPNIKTKEIKNNESTIGLIETLTNVVQNLKTK